MSGFLVKKKQKRWFVLTGGLLFWLSDPQKWESKTRANGFLIVADCRICEMMMGYTYSFVIYSTKDRSKKYMLLAASKNERDHWVSVLISVGAKASKQFTELCSAVQVLLLFLLLI